MDVLDFPGDHNMIRPTGSAVPRRPSSDAPRVSVSQSTCLHRRIPVGSFTLDLCPTTDEGRWLADGEDVDPAEALAHLFGAFDLVAAVHGVGTPGDSVLLYSPDSRRGRNRMRALPMSTWILAAPSLWLTHDGDHLLMSPEDPLLAENLAREL
jgi:hypothetical protein